MNCATDTVGMVGKDVGMGSSLSQLVNRIIKSVMT